MRGVEQRSGPPAVQHPAQGRDSQRFPGGFPITRLTDVEAQLDMKVLRRYRLECVRREMQRRAIDACLLFDPINIRYATGRRDAPLFMMHVSSGYLFLPAEGPVVLFGHGAEPDIGLETIDEIRPQVELSHFLAGERVESNLQRWSREIADLVVHHCGGGSLLAIDRCDLRGAAALRHRGLKLTDAQEALERARAIKAPEELACMAYSIAVAEVGLARMREALRPGMTENELWSILHQTNIAMGGEWIEGRLLVSGDRINPWFHECSDRMIRAGELVAFDTDMIGPFGYCADISRTYFCKPGRPSATQRDLYKLAFEELHHNLELIKPGASFAEIAAQAWRPPDRIVNRYVLAMHGIGLCDEYPCIYHLKDWEAKGLEGVIEENMTLCVESFIGPTDSREGVKLEQQVHVTASGIRLLSSFPFEDELLA
ncbi:MAG: Xaa-Pro peptidase family protein [Dongiaceae bacterium]